MSEEYESLVELNFDGDQLVAMRWWKIDDALENDVARYAHQSFYIGAHSYTLLMFTGPGEPILSS